MKKPYAALFLVLMLQAAVCLAALPAGDQGLAGRLSGYLFTNRKLDWDDKLESRVGELTAERVTAAMRRHIDPAKISIIKAGDFKKAAGGGS